MNESQSIFKHSNSDKRYLSTNELSDYLGISKWSLYKLVQRRNIPFIPIVIEGRKNNGKSLVRFDTREIDKWMKKRSVNPLATPAP